MKVAIWNNMPSHYQSSFYAALREAGVDLVVRYYEGLSKERRALGWDTGRDLPAGELVVEASPGALESVSDWRERIHVVPGYGSRFLRHLARRLSTTQVPWVHWSERAHPGLRWLASYPRKAFHARLVNQHAIGAFGVGLTALQDFGRWGIRADKMAVLPYSVGMMDPEVEPDSETASFLDKRRAFLFLGSLCPRKGTDIILRAFRGAAGHSSDWTLVLVGNDKSGGRYARAADRMKLAGKVLFRSAVSAGAIENILVTASVVVLPSRFDGWGVALNEGASAGLALIGSDMCGAAHHLIDPGINGFRVRAGSVESLKRAMGAYVQNPGLAHEHGKQSRKLFRDFTPERNAQRFVAVVRSWLSMSRA